MSIATETLSLERIHELYYRQMPLDFPVDEIKPLAMIDQSFSLGQYCGYGFVEGGQTLAYAFFVEMDHCALFDYYAVRQDLRGRGLGSRLLRTLIDGPLRSRNVVLLEVEDPERASSSEQREHQKRRLRFYLRNGLEDTGVRSAVNQVPYRVLALPMRQTMAQADIWRIYAKLYHTTLPERPFQPIGL